MREFLPITAKWVKVLLLDLFMASAGAILDIGGIVAFPRWLWVTLFILAGVIGPFWAFHKQRLKMDEMRSQLGLPRLEDQKTFFDEPWYPVARLTVIGVVAGACLVMLGVWIGREWLRAPETRWELHLVRPDEIKKSEDIR